MYRDDSEVIQKGELQGKQIFTRTCRKTWCWKPYHINQYSSTRI